MKRLPLGLLALVLAAAACQEFSTAPGANEALAVRAALRSNPPPPPIDTGASGSFNPVSGSASTRIDPAQFGAVTGSSFFFTVPVRYLFNPPENSGYLHFRNDATSNASGGSIKDQNGVLSGNGFLKLQLTNGVLNVDLSSIQQPPSFLGCGSIIPEVAGAPPQGSGGVCFHLFFSSATFTPTGGDPVQGTVNLDPTFFND